MVPRRKIQIALGLIWLLDGALQFQSFMYSQGFIREVIEPMTVMQPAWAKDSILWAAHVAGSDLAFWNTGFALVQCLIGVGLLYRPTVKAALAVSFAWVLVVWWFGEGFGMVLMDMGSPFMGAPGPVLLYGLIGLLVWPTGREDGRSVAASGLLGERGGLAVWSLVWAVASLLWIEALARPTLSLSGSLIEASGDSMPWLYNLQRSLAGTVQGDGKQIAVVLLVASVLVAAGVWTRWRRQALLLGVLVSLLYWALGQSLGGLTTGSATDPGAGPLMVLLALAVWPHAAAVPARFPAWPASSTPQSPPSTAT
jgi:hypothetical protein